MNVMNETAEKMLRVKKLAEKMSGEEMDMEEFLCNYHNIYKEVLENQAKKCEYKLNEWDKIVPPTFSNIVWYRNGVMEAEITGISGDLSKEKIIVDTFKDLI